MQEGAEQLGLALAEEQLTPLKWLADELVRWNAKVNLTAITHPEEVLEKHILDSLTPLPLLGAAETLLDLGAGAGFPGLPLAFAAPTLRIELVDSVAKKVGFMKHAIAHLGLAARVTATHATATGQPTKEGIGTAQVVISRAFRDLGPWLRLARPYLTERGAALAMVGQKEEANARQEAEEAGFGLIDIHIFTLPWSRANRAVLRLQPRL
jgi:16S rRNA (guanine527-N7)-methyltransferase